MMLQHYFEENILQLPYMDTESSVISTKTKDIIKDLKNLRNFFDLSNLSEDHELFSNKNKKVNRKINIETPKSFWIRDFICLINKELAFKCGGNRKNKLKGIFKPLSTK